MSDSSAASPHPLPPVRTLAKRDSYICETRYSRASIDPCTRTQATRGPGRLESPHLYADGIQVVLRRAQPESPPHGRSFPGQPGGLDLVSQLHPRPVKEQVGDHGRI